MLYSGGVLICADTMVSKPTVSSYESKLMGYKFDDGIAVFAFAGHVGLAENAIQRCEDDLRKTSQRPRTKAEIMESVRRILKYEYEERILKYSLVGSDYDYNIVIAVWSKADGVGLYRTHTSALNRTRRGYECIGVGDDLAEYLIRGSYARGYDVRHVTGLMAYVLAEIKAFMPASVGGSMILLRISSDGEPSIMPGTVMEIIDRHSRTLHAWMKMLPVNLINDRTAENFKQTLDNFSVAALRQWQHFADEAGQLLWAGPPNEALDLFMELRPKARRDRQGSKPDPPPQPPSPG